MARYIDADELLRTFKAIRSDWRKAKLNCVIGIERAIDELEDMPTADAVPTDYHDQCMELEISRRFAAEEKVGDYPHVLDAIHEELANAIGLVERMQGLANDKEDE